MIPLSLRAESFFGYIMFLPLTHMGATKEMDVWYGENVCASWHNQLTHSQMLPKSFEIRSNPNVPDCFT